MEGENLANEGGLTKNPFRKRGGGSAGGGMQRGVQ